MYKALDKSHPLLTSSIAKLNFVLRLACRIFAQTNESYATKIIICGLECRAAFGGVAWSEWIDSVCSFGAAVAIE